mmetsp:Transcript_2687/g.7883  ORF Transcript_2687/g.7883 Transcript_2687/m.7883 type:complete len:1003 (+) Transcript_2687:391-3399(+)|eukprot:CAMPEP_0181032332 /NCGR_PEP_ID=MMETSP1070-20121207/6688_1 /TAXON_ID=265543 /ORGANISM="Minutocellus polymorphus, Strain NH13" /LENGTH=1002 /DNA_ID=CAMNT_0023109727 /DNA_START=335 /DNA_END=3343 /DNA_ORIENTATION=+
MKYKDYILLTFLFTASSGAEANLRGGGERQLHLNWLGEEWFGHDPKDRPSLLVLQRDHRYCLMANNVEKEILPALPQQLEPRTKGDIFVARCDPDDIKQHFFLEHWERWRPAANLKKCVGISESRLMTGTQMKIEDCMKKNRSQRWQVNEHDELMPFESRAFCVTPTEEAQQGAVELDLCENRRGAGWEQVLPDEYHSYIKTDPDVSGDDGDEPYVMLISNDDDWDSEDNEPKRKCLTANSNREAVMSRCDLARSRQLWLVEKRGKNQGSKKDRVRLRPKHNLGLCLHMSGELSEAYQWDTRPVVRLKDCEKLFDDNENQHWTLESGYIHPQGDLNLCIRKGEGGGSDSDDDKNRFARVQNRCNDDSIWHFVPPADYSMPPLPPKLLEKGAFVRIEWRDEKQERTVCLEGSNVGDGRKCEETDKFGRDSRHQLWYMDDEMHLRPVDRLHTCLEYEYWRRSGGSDDDDDNIGLQRLRRGNCAMYKPYQKWRYDETLNSISPTIDPTLCLTAKTSIRCDDDDVRFGLSPCSGWDSQKFTLNRHRYRCRETLAESLFLVHESPDGREDDRCAAERINGDDKWIRLDDCDYDDKNSLWVMKNERLTPLKDPSICLEVLESEMPFAPPRLTECDASNQGQRWEYDNVTKELSPRNLSDYCISDGCDWDYTRGLCLNECGLNRRQKWAITKTPEYVPTPHTTPKTRYYVVSKDNDCGCFCCLHVSEEGTVIVGQCENNLSSNFRQREWRKETRGKGFILRKGSGCLTIGEEYTRDCDEENVDQVWQYDKMGNAEISLVGTENCLSRTTMEIVSCNGEDDQAWELVQSEEAPLVATERCDLVGDEGFMLFVLEQDPRFCMSSLGREDGMAVKLTVCNPSSHEQLWASEGTGTQKQIRPLNNPDTCMSINSVDYLEAVRIDECREADSDDDSYSSDYRSDYATRQLWLINEKGHGELSPALNPDLCVTFDMECELDSIEFEYMLGLVSCESPENVAKFNQVAAEDYLRKI